jgi:glycine hydroxymethyltransferase
MQTRDQNKYAATAYALTEMAAYGDRFAHQMVANARALAHALVGAGFTMVAAEREFTMTHQIFVDATSIGARTVEDRCRACNILFQASHMRGDGTRGFRTGLRISVQEITRVGMREQEMRDIATLIGRAVFDQDPATQVARDVEDLATRFMAPQYTFSQ